MKTRATRTPRPARKRVHRHPRPTFVKVSEVHCGDCKKRFEFSPIEKVKFCIWCRSENIQKSERTRKETPAERNVRQAATSARMMNALFGIVGQIFGPFQGPYNFTPPSNMPHQNGNKSALESELLKEGYRKLATKYHPDKGGDPEKMKELNRLKEKLGL